MFQKRIVAILIVLSLATTIGLICISTSVAEDLVSINISFETAKDGE